MHPAFEAAFTVGTAGHVDHGKSSLIEALTGVHPDRLAEEKRRGMSIELGFGHLKLPSGRVIGLVDVPGHEHFVRAMAAGIHALDAVLFVIAADEGIMPQTREHLEICKLLAVQKGWLVLTKIDLVSEPALTQLEIGLENFCRDSFLEKAPRLRVSTKTRAGLEELKLSVDHQLGSAQARQRKGPFRLWVDRSFAMQGFGTVVTGTTLNGSVRIDDEIMALPTGKNLRVRGVETYGEKVGEAGAGSRTALNLAGAEVGDLPRGILIAEASTMQVSTAFLAQLRWLKGKPHKKQLSVEVLIGTAHTLATLHVMDDATDDLFVRIVPETALPISRGDPFILRDTTPATVAGGRVLDVTAPKALREVIHEDLQRLSQALEATNEAKEIEALLGPRTRNKALAFSRAEIAPWVQHHLKDSAELNDLLQNPALTNLSESPEGSYLPSSRYEELRQMLLETIAKEATALSGGIAREDLVSRLEKMLPASQKAFWESALAREIRQKSIRVQGNRVLPGQAAPQALSPAEQEIVSGIHHELRAAGLQPPTKQALADRLRLSEKDLLPRLQYLARQRLAVRVSDEFYFDAASLQQLLEKVRGFFEKTPQLDVAAFKNISQVSRKHAIPLLEYLDREKITLRVGQLRTLRKV